LEGYTPNIIQQVIPAYYPEIRPKLDDLPNRIAEVRTRKDIKGDILGEVREYNAILLDLKGFRASLSAKIPSLEEVKRGEERKKIWEVILLVAAALIGAALFWAWEVLYK
jgi:hypothetical protein